MKRFLAILLTAWSFHAAATPSTTDWSDVWYNPAEPGWGVTIFEQADTLFVAIYNYDNASLPYWLVASGATYQGATNGVQTFSGALYETRGTYYGAPWVPSNSQIRQVGTLTLTFPTIVSGSMTYTVDGVVVTKPIQRYTFRINSMAGGYLGGNVGVYSGCSSVASGLVEETAVLNVTHNVSNQVTIVDQASLGTCTYSGAYQQFGKFGQIVNGTVSCTNGLAGTFAATEIDSGISGLTARVTSSLGGNCQWNGRLGGVRRGS